MRTDIVFGALEAALASATKKLLRRATSTSASSIDRETGDYETFRRWHVVPDEAGTAGARRTRSLITRRRASAIPTSRSTTYIEEPLEPVEFGRIGAQAAKQVILQKIRDAEREQILNDFLSRGDKSA